LYQKVRADLIAGLPLGIWFGALVVLGAHVPLMTIQVMAAGPLLRRHGARRAVLPYLERVVPAMFLIVLGLGLLGGLAAAEILRTRFGIDLYAFVFWYILALTLLVLTLTGIWRGWSWPLRLVLHAGWLLGLGLVAVRWIKV
jgi:hypothetical protein